MHACELSIYVCVLDALLVDVDQPDMSAPCAMSISLASTSTDSSAMVTIFVTVNKGMLFTVSNPMMHVLEARMPGCADIVLRPFLCICVFVLVWCAWYD